MAREFHHALGTSVSLPHTKHFKPTPTMTELEIAYFQGKEARHFGRPDSDNPYTGERANEWTRGYSA